MAIINAGAAFNVREFALDFSPEFRQGGGRLAVSATVLKGLFVGGFNTSSPLLDSLPRFGSGAYAFSATALTTGAASLGTPTLSILVLTLSGSSIRVGPVIGSPALTAAVTLFPNPIATQAPALGTPVLGVVAPTVSVLNANAITTASPILGTAAVGQKQVFSATAIATGSPTLGTPISSGPGVQESLHALDLLTNSPEIGAAGFLQIIGREPISLPQPPVTGGLVQDRHIRRNGDDYAEALTSLLPQGRAWSRDADSILIRTVTGLAQIYGFIDSRAGDLLERESDPRQTIELLTDWERNWGLPDECFLGEAQTIGGRQQFLVLKMTIQGAQSRQFFINVAADLGYKIEISEFSPFMAGVTPVGDTRPVDTSQNLLAGAFALFGP